MRWEIELLISWGILCSEVTKRKIVIRLILKRSTWGHVWQRQIQRRVPLTKTKKNRYNKDKDRNKDKDKEEQVKSEMCVNRSHSEKASVGPIPRIAGDSENGGRRTCFNLNFSFSSLTGNLKEIVLLAFLCCKKICECVFHCCSLFLFGFETWDLLLHKRDLSFAVLPVFVRQLLKFSRFLKTFSATTSSNTEPFWAAVINSHAKFHFKRVFLGVFSF